jgi:hypothetical protein
VISARVDRRDMASRTMLPHDHVPEVPGPNLVR